jgi:hypothetical protein
VLELVTSSNVPEGPTNANVADSAVPSWLTLQTRTSLVSVANGQFVAGPMAAAAVPQVSVTVPVVLPVTTALEVMVTVPESTQPTVNVPLIVTVAALGLQTASFTETVLVPSPVTQPARARPPPTPVNVAVPAGVAAMVKVWPALAASTLTVSVELPLTGTVVGDRVMLNVSADTGRPRLIMP